MNVNFAKDVFEALMHEHIDPTDSVLSICANSEEVSFFKSLGFKTVCISNIDNSPDLNSYEPYEWSFQDAHQLSFEDNSFDFCFVNAGLHHCQSPHRATTEMYRVAKKGIIIIEARDSLLLKTLNSLKLSPEFEVATVIWHNFKTGGMNNGPIPNFIYRWTEREFEKTIHSYDPIHQQQFLYFHKMALLRDPAQMKKHRLQYFALQALKPLMHCFGKIFPSQCNHFAMVALKPAQHTNMQPWLSIENTPTPSVSRSFAKEHYGIE